MTTICGQRLRLRMAMRIAFLFILSSGLTPLAYAQMPPILSVSDLAVLRPSPTEYVQEGLLSSEQASLTDAVSSSRAPQEEVKSALDALLGDPTLPHAFRRWVTLKAVRVRVSEHREPEALALARQWIEENPTEDAVNLRLSCYLASVYLNGTLEHLNLTALDRLSIIDSLLQPATSAEQSIDSDVILAKGFHVTAVRACGARHLVEWGRSLRDAPEGDHSLAQQREMKPFLERCVALMEEAKSMMDALSRELPGRSDPYGKVALEISHLQALEGPLVEGLKQAKIDLAHCQDRLGAAVDSSIESVAKVPLGRDR